MIIRVQSAARTAKTSCQHVVVYDVLGDRRTQETIVGGGEEELKKYFFLI